MERGARRKHLSNALACLVLLACVFNALPGQSPEPSSGAEKVIKDITWRIGSMLPGACKGQAQAVLGESIVGVGGAEPGRRASDTAWLLNTRTMKYTILPRAPFLLSYPQGASVGEDFYLFTGSMRQSESDSVEKWSNRMFRLSQASGSWKWTALPALKLGRLFPGCAVSGNTIVVIGGETGRGSTETATVEAFDTRGAKLGWSSLPDFPGQARESMAVAAIGEKVYVFGGMSWSAGKVLRFAEAFALDLSHRTWSRLPDLPFPAFGWEAVVYRNRYIVMAGGIKGPSSASAPNFDALVFDTHNSGYTILPSRIPPYQIHPERYIEWLRPALLNQVRISGMDPAQGVYRHGPELSLVGDKVYLCGGEVISPDLNITCEVLVGTIVEATL
jgi:hypothetical protein